MRVQVIVDVPAAGTDRPFDYLVPEHLRTLTKVGSRVIVPFGPRRLQGFVVGVTEDEANEIGSHTKLRDIEEVADPEPPLTEELVGLGLWMSNRYICYTYTALQSMLPAMMRSRYKKWVRLSADLPDEVQRQIAITGVGEQAWKRLADQGKEEWERLIADFPDEIVWLERGVKEGWLLVEREVSDRITRKKVSVVRLNVPYESLHLTDEQLSRQAAKQKDILRFFIAHPGLDEILLKDLLEAASVSRQAVLALAEKGALRIDEVETYRNPYLDWTIAQDTPPELTAKQREAVDRITSHLVSGKHHTMLLHGVTGSGKTEVYLHAISKVLQQGKGAIMLVPEISLTPQMVERFKSRFGRDVAVLHSRLGQGERFDEWRRVREGKARVVVGTRSAVFAPVDRLGLIIIDEEHESTYKQEDNPRYHARDISLYRARHHQAVVIFGSATPALETYYQATTGKIELLKLPERIGGRSLPPVHLVDMREELRNGNRSIFSRALSEAIEQRLENEEQIILFLNRRGYSTFVMCRSCGGVMQCKDCDISLTYHQHNRTLRCHYCGHGEKEPKECPQCGSKHIRFFGTGTQRVEEELAHRFPGIRVIRMDVDTTSQKGAHERLLRQFGEHKGDVLLGTQMIAKGLDFTGVSLVGVIAADTILNLPDFRAAEKTFQLLTQVGGRAGRHRDGGEVIIQTYTPDHYSIQHACQHDYLRFYEEEIEQRGKQGYPPFSRLILLTFMHEDPAQAIKTADQLNMQLRNVLQDRASLLGPVASPLARIKNQYRFHSIIKFNGDLRVLETAAQVIRKFEADRRKEGIKMAVDVDPQMLM